MTYKTEQEAFWAGNFGTDYIDRNKGEGLLASNLKFFATCLHSARGIGNCIEFGANIGMNLRALGLLYPHLEQYAIEINPTAAHELKSVLKAERVFEGSIFDYVPDQRFDLVLIKGVLIHINPNELPLVYERLFQSTGRYLLVAEYYNPTPVSIPYRGHAERLFKRDFCGELLDLHKDLNLVDYGFVYRRDTTFPQDDITWFLLEKSS